MFPKGNKCGLTYIIYNQTFSADVFLHFLPASPEPALQDLDLPSHIAHTPPSHQHLSHR